VQASIHGNRARADLRGVNFITPFLTVRALFCSGSGGSGGGGEGAFFVAGGVNAIGTVRASPSGIVRALQGEAP